MTEAKTLSAGDVHRRLVAAYTDVQAGRLDEALRLIDRNVIDHRGGSQGDFVGWDAWREKWKLVAASGFASLSITIDENVEVGEASVNRYTVRGTDGASGRSYEVGGMDMIKVRDGRVVEHWAFLDTAAILHQIGGE